MSALAQLNAIEKVKGSPADQQQLLQSIMQTHGSATNFYRAAAKEMGTTPDVVMEKVENMAQNMQPQTAGLDGANAGTTVPQTMTPPTELNANSMDSQNRSLQQQGMGTAQAVNMSAQNPQNTFAQGGPVPPTKDEAASKMSDALKNPAVKSVIDVTKDTPAMQGLPNSDDKTQQMLNEYKQQQRDQQFSKDQGKPQFGGYAKGGPVQENIKNMSLKDVIKMLASHPGLGGMGSDASGQSLHGSNLKEGGAVGGQNDPDVIRNPAKLPANMKREARSHGNGIMSMNKDVPSYMEGGEVHMDSGGGLEEDSITGYGPDGTPIVQNSDGTQGYGDINSLLGRPESAPTLGTGQDPQNATTKNAANSVAQQQPTGPAQDVTGNMMATGGEEAGAPPGALQHEVADDVPAKLSEGEFVFSADATRFWGLRLLTQMMDHARDQLTAMSNQGDIRHPGDGKNPDQEGFQQDAQPNMNAYSDKDNDQGQDRGDQMVSGIMKECMGGANMADGGMMGQSMSDQNWSKGQMPQPQMATGGGVNEEEFAKGGAVPPNSNVGPTPEIDKGYGGDSILSSHPKGGSPLMDYATGGIVTSTASNLNPKKLESSIPQAKIKAGLSAKGKTMGKGFTPSTASGGSAPAVKVMQPKMNKGGLLKKMEGNVNEQRDINRQQLINGA